MAAPSPLRWLPAGTDIVILYLLLALALLAPLASNDILPAAADNANHTAFVVEARHALEEGQLPLRIAPFANDQLRYPLFQFYAQAPYVVAGTIYRYLTPDNPWVAIKLTYLLGMTLAALFVHKLGRLLGFERTITVLAGVVYISAPYLLVNMHARGSFTEAFAQCLLPIVAYTSARVVIRGGPWALLWAALAWGVLGTSHIITFLYGTLFYGIFVAGLVVARQVTLGAGVALIVPCVLGWALSAFQWYPSVTVELIIRQHFGNVFMFRWLTPISALLSLTSVPPEPSGRAIMTPYLHPAIGAPILIAVVGLLYLRTRDRFPSRGIGVSLALFALAFACTWSPVNVWAWLPPQLLVVQFSYRFLTFTTVFGTVLFAYFVSLYQQRYAPLAFLVWLVGILLFAQSYLPPEQASDRTLASIVAAPLTSIAPEAYEFNGEVPPVPGNVPVIELAEARQHCAFDGPTLRCTFTYDGPALVLLPMLYYPSLLRVTVDRDLVTYYAIRRGTKLMTAVALEPGRHRVFATFAGSRAGNLLSLLTLPGLVLFGVWRTWRGRSTTRGRST